MIKAVRLTKTVRKALRRSPAHVVMKLLGWVDLVENEEKESFAEVTEVSKHDY